MIDSNFKDDWNRLQRYSTDCQFVLAPDSRNTSRALIIGGSQYQKTRVLQCCILSLMLFNLYLEEIFIEALDDASEGINVNGVNVNNIRYAVDTLIVTKKEEDRQKLMNKNTCTQFSLKHQ